MAAGLGAWAMTDEQDICLACGGPVGRAGRVCDECLWDTREDDHDVHEPNMAGGHYD
jgi:hypothetical protein